MFLEQNSKPWTLVQSQASAFERQELSVTAPTVSATLVLPRRGQNNSTNVVFFENR